MRIELLRFEGRPGFRETLSILERVVAEESLAAEILPITLDSGDQPDFSSSPTVLVDGEDLFPAGRRDDARATSCRLYLTPRGPKNHPTVDLVRAALMERALSRTGHPGRIRCDVL